MSSIFKKKIKRLPSFHFSIDDVFDSLIEVTDKKIPLFEHPHFALFAEMHKKYGIEVDLYLFFQKNIDGKLRTIQEIRNLKNELSESGNWIHFGPHALDYDTRPHDQTPTDQEKVFDSIYKEIDRFAGPQSYSKWVRLHFYSESYELGDYFKRHGVEALLSTDRPAASYRMPDNIKQLLTSQGKASYQEAHFIRTQFRLEFLVDDQVKNPALKELFKNAIQQYDQIVIYTHELELEREEIQTMLRVVLDIYKDLINN